MQIEPISNLTQFVDRGNLQRCKVVRSENEFDDLEEKGVTSKSGSVMKIAQRRSKYWKVEGLGGMSCRNTTVAFPRSFNIVMNLHTKVN